MPPVNDNFVDAIVISGASGTVVGDNTGATMEAGEPNNGGIVGATIWYKWTAPTTATMGFNTEGSAVGDTVLGIYTGASVGTLTEIAFDDDGGTGALSSLAFAATNATIYYVQVGTYGGGGTGSITLNWLTLPANIVAAGAVNVTSLPFVTTIDTTAHPPDTTQGALQSSCAGPSFVRPAWYKYTAGTCDASMCINVTSGTIISVFTGSPGSLVDIGDCTTAFSFVIRLDAGTTYYILLTSSGSSGSVLTVNLIPGPLNAVPAGSLALTENRQGLISFLSRTTGALLRVMHLNMGTTLANDYNGSGGWNDVAANGRFIVSATGIANTLFAAYSPAIAVVAPSILTLPPLPADSSATKFRRDASGLFYLVYVYRNIPNHSVSVVVTADGDGVLTGATWTLPDPPVQTRGLGILHSAPSPDGSILYYSASTHAIANQNVGTKTVYRYDLVNSVQLSSLVVFPEATGTYKITDILVLASGDILVAGAEGNVLPAPVAGAEVRRYSPAGALLATYPVLSAAVDVGLTSLLLSSDTAPDEFWLTVRPTSSGSYNFWTAQRISTLTDTVVATFDVSQNAPGNNYAVQTTWYFITRAPIVRAVGCGGGAYHIQVI